MKIIQDKELDYLDEKDLLETKKYAEVLEETIKNIHTPSTIGLFGEWGSGKSSIIQTAKKDIENENKKVKFVIYDAWKYANDSFRRTFLKDISEGLGAKMEKSFDSFYMNTSKDTKIESHFNLKYMLIIGVMFVAVLLLPWLSGLLKFSDDSERILQILITFFMACVAFFKNALTDYKTTIQKPAVFSPEQFEEIFDELIKLKTTRKWIISSKEYEKIVIVIDNLDRCDKKTTCETLSDIKGFLEKKNVIFIIPIDDTALLRHIESQGYSNDSESEEFLRKIFGVAIRIKKFQRRDLFIFTQKLLKNNNIKLNPNTISVITQEYASNPRRIIQFINNFQMEKIIIQKKQKDDNNFIDKYETLIAFFLILREEWKDYYQYISKNLEQLKEEQSDDKKCEKLQIFLNQTKGIWEKIDLKIMEKIVFNLDNDMTISTKLKEKIENNNLQEEDIKKCFKDIMDYLIEELRKEINYQTFKTRALRLFKTLLEIYDQRKFPNDVLNRLIPILKSCHFKLSESLEEKECQIFFRFVEYNREEEIDYLFKDYQNEFCNMWKELPQDKDYDKEKIWHHRFINFVNEVKINRQVDIAKSFFNFAYITDMIPYLNLYEVTNPLKAKNQIITNEIKTELLNNINIQTLEDTNVKILYNLGKNGRLDSDNTIYCTKNFLEKISNISLDKLSQEEKVQKIEEKVQKIIDVLKAVKYQNDQRDLLPLNGGFYNFSSSFLIYFKEEQTELAATLWCEVFKIAERENNSADLLNKSLINKTSKIKKDFFNIMFQNISKYNLSLIILKDVLLQIIENDENLFKLYEILFRQMSEQDNFDSQKKFIEDKIKQKIDALMKENEEQIIREFLINLTKINIVKNMLQDIVEKNYIMHISKFPDEVQLLVCDKICEGDFLIKNGTYVMIKNILMSSSGNLDKYQNKISDFIIYKLQEEAELESVLNAIEDFDKWNPENKERIISELERIKKERFEDRIEKYVKKLRNQQ